MKKNIVYFPTQRCASLDPCSDAVLLPLLDRLSGPWNQRAHSSGPVSPHNTVESTDLRADVINVIRDPIGLHLLTVIRHRHLIKYLPTTYHPAHGSSSSGTHQLTEVPARNTVIGPW